MRYERAEGRDREVDTERAVRGPIAQDDEPNHEELSNSDDSDRAVTRRGSSSERSDR